MKQLHNIPHLTRQPAASSGEALERLFELATYLTDAMDRELGERGLTRARAEVLYRLAALGPVTQRRLATELACTPRNVTDLVDGLQRSGLVTREPHPTDRRATLVTLTAEGSAAAVTMRDDADRTARELFSVLDPQDVAFFTQTVDRMIAVLRAPAS